jgi:ABC-type iron transport system FetAB ATPase subunit
VTTTRQLDVAGLCVGGVGPIDFWLERGECLILSGASGSGKTRVLRAIADLDDHQGRIECEGIPAQALKPAEWRRRVGMLASDSQWWRDRVDEHFDSPATEEQLEALDLAPALLAQPVAQLSSGEKQRLALLRLMVNRPRVLLLDEPTANLDPENVTRVEKLVAAYLRREGAAVLWVSHDPEQTRRVAQRRLRLQAGRLKRDGAWTPAEDAQR